MKKLFGFMMILLVIFTLTACGRARTVSVELESNIEQATLSITPEGAIEVGAEVTITASEVEGQQFVHWLDVTDNTVFSENREHTFTASTDRVLRAVYEAIPTDNDMVTITLSSDTPGFTYTLSPTGSVTKGTTVTVNAHDITDHIFLHWIDESTENVLGDQSTLSFAADADMSIKAVYQTIAEWATQTIIANFDNDLAHLQPMLGTMDDANESTMRIAMSMSETMVNSPETVVTTDVTLSVHERVLGGVTTTMFHLHLHRDDLDIDLDLMFLVEETATMVTFILNVDTLLDVMDESIEDMLDVREMFDVQDGYVHLAVPKILIEEFNDDIMPILIDMLTAEMGLEEGALDETLSILVSLQRVLTLDYLEAVDGLDITLEMDGPSVLLTAITLDSEAMKSIFVDITPEIHALVSLLIDPDAPPYEDAVETDEYKAILDFIDTLGDIVITIRHNPYTLEAMETGIDFSNLIASLESKEELTLPTFALSMHWHESEAIVEIEGSRNLVEIAEEVIQVLILNQSVEIGKQVHENETVPDGTHTLNALQDEYSINIDVPFFDMESSTVTLDTSDGRVITLNMAGYDGEPLFFEPLDFEILQALMAEPPETRESAVDDYLSLVDEEAMDMVGFLNHLKETVLATVTPD